MVQANVSAAHTGRPLWLKVVLGLVVLVALLALLLAFFPWDWLRQPLNRYVSDRTGHHFEITRRLDVKLGRTTRILADGIEFANPDWARDPYLVKAEAAEIQVRLLPLLRRQIELPLIQLRKPQLGLQIEPDGRRSWALGRDSGDPANLPVIGALVVDEGTAHFVAPAHGADIRTDFAIEGAAHLATPGQMSTVPAGDRQLPLSFKAKGTWQKEPFTAQGRTGNVLYLSAPLQKPFPLEVAASAGRTSLRASGAVASLATLDGADAAFDLQGQDLADLYKLVGIVLPATPRYALKGRLSKQGEVWHVRQIVGKLGNSDLGGDLSFDRAKDVPHLTGQLKSNSLDFDDLAPVVGLPEQPRSAAALQVAGATPAAAVAARKANAVRDPHRKVLPSTVIDLARLRAMNADVTYDAIRVTHVKQLPLERMNVHIKLTGGDLQLDPMKLGIAGGRVEGRLRIDARNQPAAAEVHLDARALELGKLFPGVELTKASFGKIHGDFDLKGRGNTVAQMLGGASGNVALLMGQGQISNLILEIAGLDGAEILKFLSSGDRNVGLRCAAAAFDVKTGLMSTRALVLDTEDTVIYGDGHINLADETLDLVMRPYPKDKSILSLRSPLHLGGTFGAPKPGPDAGALAGRAGLALALGAVNPLLALAATVETGPGKDADCRTVLREAASPEAGARVQAMARAQAAQGGALLGGPRAPASKDRTAAAPKTPTPNPMGPVDPMRGP